MKYLVALSVAAAMAIGGTAWGQEAKPKAKADGPFKQIEGVWEGTGRTRDGLPFPVRAEIKEDGTARHATPKWLPSADSSRAKVTAQKDPKTGMEVMYYAYGEEQAMVLDVNVVDGRRVLRIARPDGSVLELFERPENKAK